MKDPAAKPARASSSSRTKRCPNPVCTGRNPDKSTDVCVEIVGRGLVVSRLGPSRLRAISCRWLAIDRLRPHVVRQIARSREATGFSPAVKTGRPGTGAPDDFCTHISRRVESSSRKRLEPEGTEQRAARLPSSLLHVWLVSASHSGFRATDTVVRQAVGLAVARPRRPKSGRAPRSTSAAPRRWRRRRTLRRPTNYPQF